VDANGTGGVSLSCLPYLFEEQVSEIWIPEGAYQDPPVLIGKGHKTLEGNWIFKRKIILRNPKNNRTQELCILDDELSGEALSQMVGEAYETFLRDTSDRAPQRPPTREERLQVGAALREIREHATKRKESSAGKIYF